MVPLSSARSHLAIELFLCCLAWLLFLPILILLLGPPLLILSAYKLCLNLVVRIRHPGWVPLAGIDISMQVATPIYEAEGKVLNNIGLLFELQGNVDVRTVRETFRSNVFDLKNESERGRHAEDGDGGSFKYDRLRKYPINFGGHYYWSDPIAEKDLDWGDLIQEGKSAVAVTTEPLDFLSDWIHLPFEAGTPLWRIVLLYDEVQDEGGKGAAKTWLAFRMSHALGDGASLVVLISRLLGQKILTGARQQSPGSGSGTGMSTVDKIMLTLKAPRLFFAYWRSNRTHADYLTRHPKLTRTVYAFGSVPVEQIKRVRRAIGCKFHDVLMNLTTAAVRRFLLENISEAQLPNPLRFILPLTTPAERRDEFANKSSAVVVSVPMRKSSKTCHTTLEGEQVGQETQEQEQEPQDGAYFLTHNVHHLLFALSRVLYVVPTWLLRPSGDVEVGANCLFVTFPTSLNAHSSQQMASLSSSVSAHQDDDQRDYPVTHIYPLAGLQMKCSVLVFGFMTRGENVDFGIIGNKAMFPNHSDLTRLKGYFCEEMESLLQTIAQH